MESQPSGELELLLVHADDQREVLDGGLPGDTSGAAPKRELGTHLAYREGDLNSLPAQRWGLVAPEGPAGDRLLEIIEPLRRARQEQQGGDPVRVYRVPPRMSVDETLAWRRDVYGDEDVEERERPLYLLVLGDADAVSFDFQQGMASRSFIGRLGFADERGYEAYVHKLLASERAAPLAARARALFYAVNDGTLATTIGERALMTPTVAHAESGKAKGDFPAQEIVRLESDSLLEQLAARAPGMLFTLSHGLGPPRSGWKTPAAREAMQGAMSLGEGERLTATDVAARPFLPGGVWFFLACYGAGTPSESAYADWLKILKDADRFSGRVDSVLKGLPQAGDRPFVAALPQAALANPDGPLAVIGHVDLAWTHGFQDIGAKTQDRPSRFQGVFRAIVDGSRVALGHRALMHWYTDAAEQIAMIQGSDERARARGQATAPDADELARRANLWMQTKDLSAYVLLGDPAARLPIGERAVETAQRTAPVIAVAPVAPEPAAARVAPEPAAPPLDLSAILGFTPTAPRSKKKG